MSICDWVRAKVSAFYGEPLSRYLPDTDDPHTRTPDDPDYEDLRP